jgi:hypothetical protein
MDVYCGDSLQTGRLVRGVLLVAQNAKHRLETPPGMLRGGPDEEVYGLDLAGALGRTTSEQDAVALPAQIRAELLKDARIEEVVATVFESVEGPAVSWGVRVECYTGEGPFALVATVAGVTLEMLGGGGAP